MNRMAFLVALILPFAACSKKTEAPPAPSAQAASKPQPLPVRAVAAQVRMVPRAIDITGTLVPDETTNLSSEVPGRIAEIRYDFGQSIRKGDIVAQIDRTEYSIQLDRVKASLAQALARVGLDPSQEDATPKDTPAIRSARAQLEDAQHKLETTRKLVGSGDMPSERLVEVEKLVNSRRAALDAAQDELRTQLANIMVIRAERRLAEKRLADTTVRAPFDGTVGAKLVSPGQYIKDNVPILTLVKTYPLRLRLDIPEVAVAFVQTGSVLTFNSEAIPGKEFHATVTQVNPSLEARARALTAEARLSGGHPALKPGMFVQVKLTVSRGLPVTTVPGEALYQVAGLSKIFVLRDGHVRELRVAPGESGDGWLEVPGGLIQSGDKVAVSNLANLTDNAQVSLVP
ncbi:MAG: efflux RND transporter periplasmic adaptor subunit [Acidobacteria bacterium]|nr:efflux RND transporter periplasmic adaptor subunit [Acidobacteriota bacterium]